MALSQALRYMHVPVLGPAYKYMYVYMYVHVLREFVHVEHTSIDWCPGTALLRSSLRSTRWLLDVPRLGTARCPIGHIVNWRGREGGREGGKEEE